MNSQESQEGKFEEKVREKDWVALTFCDCICISVIWLAPKIACGS